MKPLTHIGTVQTVGRYSGDPQGPPRQVQLRGTKTRWYNEFGGWWPATSQESGGTVIPGGRTGGHKVTTLDLSTIRPMTVADFREPLERELVQCQEDFDAVATEFAARKKDLLKAADALAAFDREHRVEASGSPQKKDA